VKARAKLMDQTPKLYIVYRKLRNISIPIDLQFKLLDTLILPILTYGSEIWGYENTKQLEKLHLLSFFLFEISLFQKFTILNFIHNISISVLPSSPLS
jgi:hypothetical protein